MSLQKTPSADRLHIGIFGKVNSGKSSFINAFTGQNTSIVSEVAGTTTDLVTKAMEIPSIGPCVLIDTAGFDDTTNLGEARKERTLFAAEKTDIAILMFRDNGSLDFSEEIEWYTYFKGKKIPTVLVLNQETEEETSFEKAIAEQMGEKTIVINAKTGRGIENLKEVIVRKVPEDFGTNFITGNLVSDSDVVMLVMPQDQQAPKGRLILPQVQTIRELLDKKCIVVCVTPDKMTDAMMQFKNPPKLIVTDSQVFKEVYEKKPKESMLTSFSVLFAAYKGDLPYYIEGAKTIDSLNANSKVLIAECCTHAPLSEDIGRVKIPNLLRKRFGQGMQIDMVSGTDFPKDLSVYDLVIQCGGCMFNRTYIMSRIDRARKQHVPMTNYGVTIAHLTGILDKITIEK